MSLTKPAIYDNTHFDLEVVAPSTTPISPTGIATGFTNPVYSASWILTGVHTTGAGVTYTFAQNGEHYFSPPSNSNYIDYNRITKNTIKSWIEGTESNILHKYSICNNIQELIDSDNKNQKLPDDW